MVRSAFTFYRGAALTMANDLASTPSAGIVVQCCGDAHLCNFGAFATPERRILFAINDLDETHPAPWEWDLKRLAASFIVGCHDNGIRETAAKDVVLTCVRSYRESIARFRRIKTLEVWYHAIWAENLIATMKNPILQRRAIKQIEKERTKSAAEEFFPSLSISRERYRSSVGTRCPPSSMRRAILPGRFTSTFSTHCAGIAPLFRLPANRYTTGTRYGTQVRNLFPICNEAMH